MSQDARRARRAGKVVLQLYKQYEPHVADAAARLGVTCREGCAHCCMLPATATVPEMVPVVEHLVSKSDWLQRKPALEHELTRQLREFATVDVLDDQQRRDYFDRQSPCAFLKGNRCEIYALRPTVCRYHMVVSPPDNCALGSENSTTARVDLSKLETDISIRAAHALGELTGGPIALAFVLAARMLGVRLDVDPKLVDKVQISRIDVSSKKDLVASAGDP